MSEYFVSCETIPTVDVNGAIYCDSPVIRETTAAVVELTPEEVSEITGAVLALFVTAFLLRVVRQFLFDKLAPGRQ